MDIFIYIGITVIGVLVVGLVYSCKLLIFSFKEYDNTIEELDRTAKSLIARTSDLNYTIQTNIEAPESVAIN